MAVKDNVVKPKYAVGQKVVINPGTAQAMTEREDDITRYAGQVGKVADYYWISPGTGQVFYIYNIKVDKAGKEIVVYEDELDPSFS